jgi:hypothetical protein
MLAVATYAAQPDTESFDLEVTLMTPINPDFTMQTTVRIGQPFEITATNGGISNRVSGTLQTPTNGVYPLDLTVSEWASETQNIHDPMKLELKLGKSWAGGPLVGLIYIRWVTLRKHESRWKHK